MQPFFDSSVALTYLTRIARRKEYDRAWLIRAFAGRPLEELAEAALEVAVETGDPIGKILADRIEQAPRSDAHYRLVERLLEKLPEHSLALSELAALLPSQLLDFERSKDRCDLERIAFLTNYLAARLGGLGKWEDSMHTAHQAVQCARKLSKDQPEADFRLATALANLARSYGEIGRREQALDAGEQAVCLFRRLAEKGAGAYKSELAASLLVQAKVLAETGRHSKALEAAREAAKLHQERPVANPSRWPRLAIALESLAKYEGNLGQFTQALAHISQAVNLYRQLSARQPETYEPLLAVALNNMASRLSAAGQFQEALSRSFEATAILRQLAGIRQGSLRPTLAALLIDQAAHLREMGDRNGAVRTALEARKVCGELAMQQPSQFDPLLAASLSNLAAMQREVGQLLEASAAIVEASEIYRRLAAAEPDAFNEYLSSALNNLAMIQSEQGRKKEALEAGEEAARIYRHLESSHPARFRPALAGLLSNLSVLYDGVDQPVMAINTLASRLSESSRHAEAIGASVEAVNQYRLLWTRHPEAFLPKLAAALANLIACIQSAAQQPETFRQGARILLSLASVLPSSLHHQLATGLNELGLKLKAHGLGDEALSVTREAIALYRQLVVGHPGTFEAHLALSLNNQGLRLRELGQAEESVEPLGEAIERFRVLAAERPDSFVPYLAPSLHNLGLALRDLGRIQDALAASEEGVRLLAPLFLDKPGDFRPWMAKMVSDYRKTAKAGGVRPDEELLATVEEMFSP